MSLWYQDSFDAYGTSNLAQRFASITGTGMSLQPNGRTGVQALNVNTSAGSVSFATIKGVNIVLPASWWIGAALQIPAGQLVGVNQFVHPWLFPQIGGVNGLGMQIRGDGSLYNAVTGAQAASGSFQFGVWQYVEMAVITTTTTIETTFFINDVQVADATVALASYPANITAVQIGIAAVSGAGNVPTCTLLMDDFYLCDNSAGTGLFVNSRCGDVDIFEQVPAGPGRVSGVWSNNGGGGSQNWQNCSTQPPNTAAYINDATAGDEECFTMSTPSGPATDLIAMQVSVYAQKSSASGNRSLAAGIGNGSAEGMNPGQALTNAWQYYIFPFSNDPVSGGAFDATIPYQAAVQTVT